MKPEKIVSRVMDDEGGFVLVAAMIVLLILTLIGISALNTSNTEIQIGGNDRMRKQVFSQADGGTQLAARLVEESIGSRIGFTALTLVGADNVLQDPDLLIKNNTVLISNTTIWKNTGALPPIPTDAARDAAFFPDGYTLATANTPHTNITVSGVTSAAAGSGLQMVAGYEGKGKGTAGGGGQILYTIFSQHIGLLGSESVVQVGWRHIIGLELEGRY